jgi:hypothetical protein
MCPRLATCCYRARARAKLPYRKLHEARPVLAIKPDVFRQKILGGPTR